jgi:hypothetical protein
MMFIQISSPEWGEKVRIAIDKILFYVQNYDDNGPKGSMMCLLGGNPFEVIETPDEIDRAISLRLYGRGESTGPKG